MSQRVKVAGVGMIPFTKPGASDDYPVMGEMAARLALEDAGIDYKDVQQAYVGYVYGDSTAGQAALYGLGLTGIPVVNVNNNCATGSSIPSSSARFTPPLRSCRGLRGVCDGVRRYHRPHHRFARIWVRAG